MDEENSQRKGEVEIGISYRRYNGIEQGIGRLGCVSL